MVRNDMEGERKSKPRQRLIDRRVDRELTQEDVAVRLGVDVSTIKRIESGITVNGLRGKRRRYAEILDWPLPELNRALNGSERRGLRSGWFHFFTTQEQSATDIYTYEFALIPGLLQTEDYAMELLGDEEAVAERRERQAQLTRDHDPVHLTAAIDERALTRPVGGPAVLAAQHKHLLRMNERDNIEVSAFPADTPDHPIPYGAPVIIKLISGAWVVYLEHRTGATYLTESEDVEKHFADFTDLLKLTIPLEQVLSQSI